VECTGHSGEHYIARDRSGYWKMWRAAVGGGLLTVITAAIKSQLVGAHRPLFVEGFLIGTDYAIPFVLPQILHFALATKQPSMTAAAGWAENFLVFNRISHALVQHPLSHRFGTRHMARMAGWLERNATGWSNSIVLGYLHGLTPVIARFFGIPLDVRHVTLSTGWWPWRRRNPVSTPSVTAGYIWPSPG